MRIRTILAAGAALIAMGAVAEAHAATIIPVSTSRGSFVVDTLSAGDDLRNNGAFSSRNTAYGLYEGQIGDQSSILLHYDRSGGAFSLGRVTGLFQIQLAANETLTGIVTGALGLIGSDPANGVHYQQSLALFDAPVTLLRGLEPGGLPLVGDYVNVAFDGLHTYTVQYDFQNDGVTMDEARFLISSTSAVPEPATWALMIAGFGLAGASLRRRRAAVAA